MARSHVRLSTVSDLRDLRILKPWCFQAWVAAGRPGSRPPRSWPAPCGALRRTLIQLAIAFVLNHPASTAALIEPRTMEQLESQLAAAEVVLDQAVLDRIDETVPPGSTIIR
jgi:hypothetical protein